MNTDGNASWPGGTMAGRDRFRPGPGRALRSRRAKVKGADHSARYCTAGTKP